MNYAVKVYFEGFIDIEARVVRTHDEAVEISENVLRNGVWDGDQLRPPSRILMIEIERTKAKVE